LPTSFRRHSRKTASFSAVAADGFAELNAVVFGIPPAATALEGPFATFDVTALGFESVKAVRAGAACNASFFPVMLMTGTQHGYAWRTANFFIAAGILSSYSFYGLILTISSGTAGEEEEEEEAFAVPYSKKRCDHHAQNMN
jgi:hypothetical protein